MAPLYIEVTFTGLTEDIGDMLIALLSEQGFDAFEESPDTLKAFILKDSFNEDALSDVVGPFRTRYTLSEIADTNWNDAWESSFQPVVIDDFCTIRADFHEAFPITGHEIIITPKMSFGTGHHATTSMMISQMKDR